MGHGFGLNKKMGSLYEGSVPVTFISLEEIDDKH
jgi:hypothetical protein